MKTSIVLCALVTQFPVHSFRAAIFSCCHHWQYARSAYADIQITRGGGDFEVFRPTGATLCTDAVKFGVA